MVSENGNILCPILFLFHPLSCGFQDNQTKEIHVTESLRYALFPVTFFIMADLKNQPIFLHYHFQETKPQPRQHKVVMSNIKKNQRVTHEWPLSPQDAQM
jgi:hypothetical protein